MNLVICHTPFQMYLFEKILKKYPNEEYHLINYFFTDTPKRKYYFKRLSKFCLVSEEVFCINGFQLFLKTFYLSRRYKNQRYNKVFLSSIDSILCQTILSSIVFDELITFDDGLANITQSSVLYMENQSSLVTLANKILGNKYSIQAIKNKVSKHFTIFDAPNISPNLEKIEIIDDVCGEISNVNPEKNSQVSILLGQPLYSTNSENIHFYKKVINLISIDYYFPHP
ncbi:TPA: glycosyltransferase family 52, partial [Streptococcus suis]